MSDSTHPPKRRCLKPQPRKRPNPKPPKPSAWQPHQSEYAIDPWGLAIRVLKAQNVDFNQ